MKKTRFFLLICVLVFCRAAYAAGNQKETVFVSILPQKTFVQQISGESLAIEVMVQPGASPATYEPKPSQMRNLASSKGYFAIGVPFEKAWLDKIAGVNPKMVLIHSDQGIDKIAMETHEHEGEEEHLHNGLDPHIWLSPPLVKKQADNILAGLTMIFPEKAELFRENHRKFINRIDELHGNLQRLMRDQRGKHFMVFHPSWGYFAREYGLEQIAIEIEGKSPKPAQLQELINKAKKHDIRIIFAQKQFSSKNAKAIARAIGGKVVLVDPLAEDWFANMQDVAEKFLQAAQ